MDLNMEIENINQTLKRKCNIENENIKVKKVKIDNKVCSICNNKFTQLPIVQIFCKHYVHIYCMLSEEIKNFTYDKPYKCLLCNKHNKIELIIRNKQDILNLVDIYFDMFKIILEQLKIKDRAFYEYKRNLFYIITKKIGLKLNCKIKFLDNINSKFIITANDIHNEDILISKFDYT